MSTKSKKDVVEVASHDLFSVGDRFRFKDMKTMWEVLEVAERGLVVGQYLPGSPYHHGHKHLIEWSHRPNLISLNEEVSGPPPVTPESKQSATGGFAAPIC